MKVADMHCDTLDRLYSEKKQGRDTGILNNEFQVDLEKMKAGDYLIQNFALYTNTEKTEDPLDHALNLLDLFYQQMESCGDQMGVVRRYEDLAENKKAGRLSAMLTIEDAGCCRGSLSHLRNFYRLGVRMMTFTWNYPNELGFPNKRGFREDGSTFWEPDTTHGLTQRGYECLEEMERLGMIMDVSHLSDRGFYDVLSHTKKPFVASHSNARAVTPHPRNLTDHMIRSLAERGGVSGINYYRPFLMDLTSPETIEPTMAAMVTHIRHFIRVGGIDCVGLGSDFDGIPYNPEMESAAFLPHLERALVKAGLHPWEIEAVFYKNVLRVYKEVLNE